MPHAITVGAGKAPIFVEFSTFNGEDFKDRSEQNISGDATIDFLLILNGGII